MFVTYVKFECYAVLCVSMIVYAQNILNWFVAVLLRFYCGADVGTNLSLPCTVVTICITGFNLKKFCILCVLYDFHNEQRLFMQTGCRCSVIVVETILRAGRCGFDARQRQKIFPFSMAFTLALGPTQPRNRWVAGVLSATIKRPGREVDHLTSI